MKLQPMQDRVVLKVTKAAEPKTASGLFMPEASMEKSNQAEVVAVGPGAFVNGVRVPMDVNVGDTVIFSEFSGTEVKSEGEEYLIVRQADIIAIIK